MSVIIHYVNLQWSLALWSKGCSDWAPNFRPSLTDHFKRPAAIADQTSTVALATKKVCRIRPLLAGNLSGTSGGDETQVSIHQIYTSIKSIITGWWFGTFYIFPYIGNSHPNWLLFFRGVGQPPTRSRFWFVCSCVSNDSWMTDMTGVLDGSPNHKQCLELVWWPKICRFRRLKDAASIWCPNIWKCALW